MKKSVRPSTISGSVKAPPSKSVMQRAVAAALLDERESRLRSISDCNDGVAALRVAELLGASVMRSGDEVRIRGGLKPSGDPLNCGEGGLCIRMFTPIASLVERPLTITGEGSLLVRPVDMIEKPLRNLGVTCSTNNGFPPIRVQGPLRGGVAEVDGRVSSQFLTGLLLALPIAAADSELRVIDLKSIAYVDITLMMLRAFGVEVDHTDYATFRIRGGQHYTVGDFTVEGDWSAAAFLLVAGAIAGKVKVTGVRPDSAQADRGILRVLELAGVALDISEHAIIAGRSSLNAFTFDATHCPDLFPPLVALACNCRGTTHIRGVERLRHKESDRAAVLMREFSHLGAHMEIAGNTMQIRGGELTGGSAFANNDHRIAMALAVAALTAGGEVVIDDAESVAKSFPSFFEKLAQIGGDIHE